MKGALLIRTIAPFYLGLALLIGAALMADAVLHMANAVWIGRYLGIPGTLLILGSFGHSLRKRKIIRRGSPLTYLKVHQAMGWTGALLVLIHAGIHFNAVLAWLAVLAMIVNLASGLTGKYLLRNAQHVLSEERAHLRDEGEDPAAIEQELHWDSLAFGLVQKWREIHHPIAMVFAVLATAHIIASLLFWNWR